MRGITLILPLVYVGLASAYVLNTLTSHSLDPTGSNGIILARNERDAIGRELTSILVDENGMDEVAMDVDEGQEVTKTIRRKHGDGDRKRKKNKGREFDNRVLLVRHGEKDEDGSIGLNKQGRQRAKCFRDVFGIKSSHNIGLILAEAYDEETGRRKRPYSTVKDLAKDLGLSVNVDCAVEDARCVRQAIEKFSRHSPDKDVMICWKHSMLNVIAQELGARANKTYPDERFDILWTLQRQRIIAKHSENCPGLDYYRAPPDPDLDIEREEDIVEGDPVWSENDAIEPTLDGSRLNGGRDQIRFRMD